MEFDHHPRQTSAEEKQHTLKFRIHRCIMYLKVPNKTRYDFRRALVARNLGNYEPCALERYVPDHQWEAGKGELRVGQRERRPGGNLDQVLVFWVVTSNASAWTMKPERSNVGLICFHLRKDQQETYCSTFGYKVNDPRNNPSRIRSSASRRVHVRSWLEIKVQVGTESRRFASSLRQLPEFR